MTAAIEVEHLHKSYGGFAAVQDLSFSVEAGEVLCLLGPNGAGKTTTTEILEGYRDRTSGRVSVLGHDPGRRERALRERVGIVLQECGVQDELTVAELIDMYGSYGPRRIPTDTLIELVELDAKASTPARALSGGQRRRLDVALALVGDPELIFLDEPTTGFDPAARRASWSMFRMLSELGKTVLLTTHFMDEAEALADRIVVVAGGRIVAEGTPATLGGRHRAATVIDAVLPTGVGAERLPDLGAAAVSLHGDHLRIETEHAVATTNVLTGWALRSGIEMRGLSVSQPSLEDVYLSLTNHLTDTRTKENAR